MAAAAPARELGVTPFTLLLAAVARTLREEPAFNAHWTDDGPVLRESVDLGVAIAVPGGLLAPAVMGADGLEPPELAAALAELAERARAGRLRQRELTSASFTVSNLGAHRVSSFAAIVNPPQVAILATGRAEPRPFVVDGALTVRRTLFATLSVDHRALDGADAGRFLDRLKDRLEAAG